MRIAVINRSPGVYNLATHKMLIKYRREQNEVFFSRAADFWALRADKAFISIIFTYDLPGACQDINLLKSAGVEVEVGGPAATAMPQYIEEKTGITPHIGLDDRYEWTPGKFKMTFTSRGCRNKCPWCIVPLIEPERREYNNFLVPVGDNPSIGDNNLLATSWEHQQIVVNKLRNVHNLDINSGLEAALFTEEHYQLYSQLHLERWRFAFDSMGAERGFERAIKILKNHEIRYSNISVFVLIGFPGTTFEEAVYRLEKARTLGCSPYPQRFMPLHSVQARNYVAPGWDAEKLKALRAYWTSAFIWRSCTFEEFKVKYKSELVNIDNKNSLFDEENEKT